MNKRLRKKRRGGEFKEFGFGGRIGTKLDGFVTRHGRASATDEDCAALSAFLEGAADVVGHEIGVLKDAWH